MVCKYSRWSRGQEEALLNKLGGLEVAMRLLDCRKVTVRFGPDKSAVIEAIPVKFPVWKWIKIGTQLKTADDFLRELEANNCQISDMASDLLYKPEFKVSEVDEEIELGNASVAELGFTKPARRDEICARIVEIGHGLCEAEDGPQLRVQYKDQPPNELLLMAMKAIRASNGVMFIFLVGHGESGLWLSKDYCDHNRSFGIDDRFVFRLRKRPLVA